MRVWWIAAAILLAGCLSAAPPPATRPATATHGVQAEWLVTSLSGTETSLAVTPSGTLFYAGARDEPGARPDPMSSLLGRSRDGGRTWDDVTPRLPDGEPLPPSSVDPGVRVDPATGRVLFSVMFPRDVCGLLSWSDDEGDTWASSPLFCGTHPPFDHPVLAAAKPRAVTPVGYPSVLHACINQVAETQCTRSLDGGLTWTAGAAPFLGVDPGAEGGIQGYPGGVCGGLSGPLRAAPDGTLYLPREFCRRPFVAVSRDDGLTWTARQVSQRPALNGPAPDLAIDADGNAFLAWLDDAGALWLAASRDGGETWQEPGRVTPEGVTAQLPAIAAAGRGQVVVGFLGTHGLPEGFRDPGFALAEPPANGTVRRATWEAWVATSADALRPGTVFAAAPAGSGPILRGLCDPRYCPGPYSDYNGAAVAPDGTAFLSFVDWCPGPCKGPDGDWRDVRNDAPGAAGLAILRPWASPSAPEP